MTTTRQRKRKTVEAPQKHNASSGCSGVKTSTNRSNDHHQKATGRCEYNLTEEDPGVSPSTAAQVLSQRLASLPETIKEIPAVEPRTRQFHASTKIKLQLFPIDEGTRIGLEKDGHNPFLELTLRPRKKISSVLKHISTKWGSSSVALGEPMLFPYNILLENLSTGVRWTLNDTGISAGDVYATIETPSIFRLRYGWFSNIESNKFRVPSTSTSLEGFLESEGIQKGCSTTSELTYDQCKKFEVTNEEFEESTNKSKETDAAVATEQRSMDVPVDRADEVKKENGLAQSIAPWDDCLTNLNIGGLLSEASLQGKIDYFDSKSNRSKSGLQPIQLISDISIGGLLSEASLQGKINNFCGSTSTGSKLGLQPTVDTDLEQAPCPWDDSLTTLSIGGLLSEASLQGKINYCDPNSNASKSGLQSTPLISDSFDAFIAGQIKSHPQAAKPSSHDSHSSILDAEETCHAFPFRKFSVPDKDVALSGRAVSGSCSHDASSNSFKFPNFSELNKQTGLALDPPRQESNTELLHRSRVYNEDGSLGLTGIKWNDSFGPFDLGLSSLQQVSSGDSIGIKRFVR